MNHSTESIQQAAKVVVDGSREATPNGFECGELIAYRLREAGMTAEELAYAGHAALAHSKRMRPKRT